VSGITIDAEKCTLCGACIAECPAYVLAAADDTATVVAPERCIICGHCVAVCPADAVSHADLPGACDAIDAALGVNPPALMQLMRTRRSIRSYTDEPVSDDDLKALLQAAVYAPSGHNDQSWQFIVIRGRDKLLGLASTVTGFMESLLKQLSTSAGRDGLRKLLPPTMVKHLEEMMPSFRLIVESQRGGVDIVFRGAPALIVIHTPRGLGTATEDAHYAAGNIMLMAHAMGLGTCLVGFLVGPARHSQQIASAIGIPPENEIGTALVVGHPKHRYHRIVPRREPPVKWV
jgi:nitroreductase/NAD-dependent dihydropyrimidine dehydrogenase PreA subunit